MYTIKSLVEGLGILGFDKDVIRKVAREKNLEEIFLSNLSINYFLVMITFFVSLAIGGFRIEGRELNMPVFFGLLMVYPFIFNTVVYILYGFFGLMAELLDKRKTVKPLLSVGYHTAVVYSILLFIIGFLSMFSVSYGLLLISLFMLYFIYTMFLSISTIYNYSFSQTLIVVFVPFLIIGIILMITLLMFPNLFNDLIGYLLI